MSKSGRLRSKELLTQSVGHLDLAAQTVLGVAYEFKDHPSDYNNLLSQVFGAIDSTSKALQKIEQTL